MLNRVTRFALLLGALAGLGLTASAYGAWFNGEDKIRIVATTSTLASLAGEVAGDKAQIHYVASPKRNLHFVSPTPKDVLKVRKADVFIHYGLDAEPWRDPLLHAAGNEKVLPGGKGFVDVSRGIPLLQVPEDFSRKEGDIHLYGNPHYWTDPVNAGLMVQNISEALASLYPGQSGFFRENARDFQERLNRKIKDWRKRMEPFQGTAIVTYHKNWPYFAKRFGLEIAGHLEPKPGIPPSAKHLAALKRVMKEKGVRLIVQASYYESRTAERMAEETGAHVLYLAQNVNEKAGTGDYISMMEHNIKLLEKVLLKS